MIGLACNLTSLLSVLIHPFMPDVSAEIRKQLQVYIQLFQLRLSTSNAEKSNTSAKGCWESLTN